MLQVLSIQQHTKRNNLGQLPNLIKTPTEVHYAKFFELNMQVMCLTGCLSPLTFVTSLTPEVTWPWGDTWEYVSLTALYSTLHCILQHSWKNMYMHLLGKHGKSSNKHDFFVDFLLNFLSACLRLGLSKLLLVLQTLLITISNSAPRISRPVILLFHSSLCLRQLCSTIKHCQRVHLIGTLEL